MNKIVSIKETSAIFLAIVLVLGTIALALPSFSVEKHKLHQTEKRIITTTKKRIHMKKIEMTNQETPMKKTMTMIKTRNHMIKMIINQNIHHMENMIETMTNLKKKVKCNNINVNLNGIDVNIGLPFNNGPVTNLVALAQDDNDDDEIESNYIENDNDKSYDGADGKSNSNTNSKIVCINNNNNIVAVGEPEPPTCEECFTKVLSEEEEKLDDLIEAIENDGGPASLQELCELFTEFVQDADFRAFISERLFTLGGDVEIPGDKINEILDCLEEVFGEDFPREFNGEPLTVQQMNWKSWNN